MEIGSYFQKNIQNGGVYVVKICSKKLGKIDKDILCKNDD